MNKQSKDGNISWTDYTWNPIRGLCPVNCKLPDGASYCYARAIYKRFKMNPEIRSALDDPYHISVLQNLNLKPGTKVFVCSTVEIFHPEIKKEWRDEIFVIIRANPDITFQILTKMPENIDRPMPGNVWLGVSIGDDLGKSIERTASFIKHIKQNKGFYFLSLEPLIYDEITQHSFDGIFPLFGWIIVGRLTGHGKKHDPSRKCIARIVDNCEQLQIPIFLKNNLKEIWQGKLIQEFPDCGGVGGNFGNK